MPLVRIKHIITLLFLLFCTGLVQPLFGQLTESQAKEILAQKGIPEDTLRVRLIKKGYDPDKIRPDQVAGFQDVIIQTIQEIEADQKARILNQNVPKPETANTTPPANQETAPVMTVVQESITSPDRSSIYGHDIFRNNSIAVYQRSDEIVPTDDYILGTGDKIGVVAYGRSVLNESLVIGDDGTVQPSLQQRIFPHAILAG